MSTCTTGAACRQPWLGPEVNLNNSGIQQTKSQAQSPALIKLGDECIHSTITLLEQFRLQDLQWRWSASAHQAAAQGQHLLLATW